MKPGSLRATGGSAVALLLASCAAAGHDATERIPTMHASSGEYREGEYRSEHGERRYRTYTPAPGDGDPVARPLVVMLHGCTQDADDFARGTRANAAAERAGALLLYPEQAPSAHPQSCWNWFDPAHQTRDRGEPALLAGMTRHVARELNADPERIFVAGISAGGSMAQILAATYPDLYRSLAVHSSPPFQSARDVATALAVLQHGVPDPARLPDLLLAAMADRTRPMPILVIHGYDDPIVRRVNGEHVLRQWGGLASRLGETTSPTEARADGDAPASGCPELPGLTVHREEATGPGGTTPAPFLRCVYGGEGVRLEYWLVPGLGHAWAGGSPAGTYTDPQGPDATSRIFEFFLEGVASAP
jgi:poly(hydroxyalkanoate) depolymerase family esterase